MTYSHKDSEMVRLLKKKLLGLIATLSVLLSAFVPIQTATAASAGLTSVLTVPSTNFSGPNNLVVGGDFIWVVNQNSRKITKVDRFSGAVIGSTAAFVDTPNKIAWDGTNAWVSFNSGGKVARVDQSLNTTLSGQVCSSGGFNDSVAAAAGRVFVSCFMSYVVAELNVDTLAVAQTANSGQFNFGLRANSTHVYVDVGSAVKIYTADNLATAPTTVNTGMPTNSLHQMTLDADYFWIVGFNTGQTAKLGRLKLSDRSVTLYTVSTVANASHNPIATDGRFVYLPNTTTNAFESFDITAGTWGVEVASTIPTGVATTPGEVWAILGGALVKYTTNVQAVSWSPTNTSNALASSPVTPNAMATSSGSGAISYVVASAGTAQCTVNSSTAVVTAQSTGTCTIRALAAATANESSGYADVVFTFSAQVQTVTWAPTNTSALASAGSLTPDSLAMSTGPGVISYAVQSAGGTGCQVNVSTAALTFTTAGTCVVRATAAAGSGYGSGSADVSFTFTLQAQTVTWAPTNTTAVVSAASLTPNALATRSGAGTISYSVSSAGGTGCSVNSTTAVLAFSAAGTCVVRATVAASGGYSSAYADVSFTITLQGQTVNWSPTNTTIALPVTSLTPNALASSTGPGTISYSVSSAGTTGCTVNTATAVIMFSADGTCVIRATAASTASYSSATRDVTFTISPDPSSVSMNSNSNQAMLTGNRIQIFALTPRTVVIDESPVVRMSTSQALQSALITIEGSTIETKVDASGYLTFALPKLSLGQHSMQIVFSESGKLTFVDAFAVVEKQPVKLTGVELISRVSFTPSDSAGVELDTKTQQVISKVATSLGPVFTLKCIGYVSSTNNNSATRKAALSRATTVCKTASQAVAAGSFAAQVKTMKSSALNIRKILLELVFKK